MNIIERYFEGDISQEDFEAKLTNLFESGRELESCEVCNSTWYYVQLTEAESPLYSGIDSAHVALWHKGIGTIYAEATRYMKQEKPSKLQQFLSTKAGPTYYEQFMKDFDDRENLYQAFQMINIDCYLAGKYSDMASFDDSEYYSCQIEALTEGTRSEQWCDETANLFTARALADGFHYWAEEPEGIKEFVEDKVFEEDLEHELRLRRMDPP